MARVQIVRSVETTPLSPVDRFLDKSVGKKCTVFFFCLSTSIVITAQINEENLPQLERKRHIGNDIVNIVFLDGSVEDMAAFSPNCIKSQFTRTFVSLHQPQQLVFAN